MTWHTMDQIDAGEPLAPVRAKLERAWHFLSGQIRPFHYRGRETDGLKFTDFKVRYHDGQLASDTHRNAPIALPAEYTKVRDAVLGSLDTSAAEPG